MNNKNGGVSGVKYVNMSSEVLRALMRTAPGPTASIISAHLRHREEKKK